MPEPAKTCYACGLAICVDCFTGTLFQKGRVISSPAPFPPAGPDVQQVDTYPRYKCALTPLAERILSAAEEAA